MSEKELLTQGHIGTMKYCDYILNKHLGPEKDRSLSEQLGEWQAVACNLALKLKEYVVSEQLESQSASTLTTENTALKKEVDEKDNLLHDIAILFEIFPSPEDLPDIDPLTESYLMPILRNYLKSLKSRVDELEENIEGYKDSQSELSDGFTALQSKLDRVKEHLQPALEQNIELSHEELMGSIAEAFSEIEAE